LNSLDSQGFVEFSHNDQVYLSSETPTDVHINVLIKSPFRFLRYMFLTVTQLDILWFVIFCNCFLIFILWIQNFTASYHPSVFFCALQYIRSEFSWYIIWQLYKDFSKREYWILLKSGHLLQFYLVFLSLVSSFSNPFCCKGTA
jgi:hypothetical protein